MIKQKFKLYGEEFEFELKVNNHGFSLWTKNLKGLHQVWILDASTICDDGTFAVGKDNQNYHDGSGYKFVVERDNFKLGNTNFQLVRKDETQKIPLDMASE